MISWKSSFKEINKDLELTKKKKNALEALFNEGRISQSTYESLEKEITDAIMDIEARRKALAEKVTSKISELEQQITVLEMFLANSEIEYVAGEIDEELHQRESNAFALGLEATKQELNAVKDIVSDMMLEEAPTPPSPPSEVTEALQTEELVEKPPETAVEAPPEPETISEETPGEQLMETPAEKPFVEEPVEAPYEAPSEAPPEEAPAEREEFQPSEEAAEETVEETTETYEVPDETSVEEASAEEEAATEEEYSG